QFIQESKNQDADFAIIWPEKLEANKEYKVTVEYAGGDALRDLGGGNYFLGPRLTWYPNNKGTAFGDRARFDMTFHYPKSKMLFTRIAMTQQPAPNFGQAWPTLVYMPFTAFQDATQRWLETGSVRMATNDFFQYVGPHEIAHQWWGHAIGWKSYRDQWMSEGFAEFSASLYAQIVRGQDKFQDFWENQRKLIIESRPQTRDRKPYTVGPVTQGYRLNSG